MIDAGLRLTFLCPIRGKHSSRGTGLLRVASRGSIARSSKHSSPFIPTDSPPLLNYQKTPAAFLDVISRLDAKKKLTCLKLLACRKKKTHRAMIAFKITFSRPYEVAQFNANSNSLIIFTTPYLPRLAKLYCEDISVVNFIYMVTACSGSALLGRSSNAFGWPAKLIPLYTPQSMRDARRARERVYGLPR